MTTISTCAVHVCRQYHQQTKGNNSARRTRDTTKTWIAHGKSTWRASIRYNNSNKGTSSVAYLPSISGTLGDTGVYRHTAEQDFNRNRTQSLELETGSAYPHTHTHISTLTWEWTAAIWNRMRPRALVKNQQTNTLYTLYTLQLCIDHNLQAYCTCVFQLCVSERKRHPATSGHSYDQHQQADCRAERRNGQGMCYCVYFIVIGSLLSSFFFFFGGVGVGRGIMNV